MDEVLYEILQEVKNLSVQQAELRAILEGHKNSDAKQDIEIAELRESVKSVREHGVIIKAMLWVYGIIVSFIISKEIGKFIS
jgi:hypothetical protein